MRVKVVQLGRGVRDLDIEAEFTVRDVLDALSIPLTGMDVRVDGESIEVDQPVGRAALITVVPLIKGGGQTGGGPIGVWGCRRPMKVW